MAYLPNPAQFGGESGDEENFDAERNFLIPKIEVIRQNEDEDQGDTHPSQPVAEEDTLDNQGDNKEPADDSMQDFRCENTVHARNRKSKSKKLSIGSGLLHKRTVYGNGNSRVLW